MVNDVFCAVSSSGTMPSATCMLLKKPPLAATQASSLRPQAMLIARNAILDVECLELVPQKEILERGIWETRCLKLDCAVQHSCCDHKPAMFNSDAQCQDHHECAEGWRLQHEAQTPGKTDVWR